MIKPENEKFVENNKNDITDVINKLTKENPDDWVYEAIKRNFEKYSGLNFDI